MTPTTFMMHSMAIDPRRSVVESWTPVCLCSMLPQGSLPLCPPGLPFLYFFLKACSYVINAISHQTKRRVATPMTSWWSTRALHKSARRRGHRNSRTNTKTDFRTKTVWQRARMTHRDRTFIKKGAKHMPPFL